MVIMAFNFSIAESSVHCAGQAERTPSDFATSAAQQRPAMVSAPKAKQQASRAAACPRNTQVRQLPKHSMITSVMGSIQ